jgi:hypothetical protein
VTTTRFAVSDVVIETPRYGGAGGGVTGGPGGEHDIIGHGWAYIEDSSITIAVHPHGVVGMLEPKEKRTYALADVVSWHATGESIGIGVGKLGLFATNGADAPIHICQMKCEDANAAAQLTKVAKAAGLLIGREQHFHGGI